MSVYNQSRKNVISLIFIVLCCIIIFQLFNLQVFNTKYSVMADEQGKFRKVIYPDRGILYTTAKGKAVLQNTIIYDLMVTPSKLKGLDTLALCKILGY